jgi:putative salt-induced outer membrane protein YdiY
VVKSDLLFLRGKKGEDLTVNRLGFNARDQYQLTSRTFAYGQLQYLHDTFKDIDYLVAPTAGVGYKLVDVPSTALTVDGGLGGVWEKNPGFDSKKSGAVTASEHLVHKLSDTANVSQQLVGLWKTSDFGDALYTFGATLAANLTSKSQVKIDLLDSYKAKPPTAAVKSNDVAIVFSIGYKL